MKFQVEILFILQLLFTTTKCLTAQGCFNLGFKLCLDSFGQCTYSSLTCAKICVSNNSCSSNCCHEGYCTSQSAGSCTSSNQQSQIVNTNKSPVVAIVVPIVFGLVIIIGIACFCYQRRKRQLALQALQQAAQKNNNDLMNNQYRVDVTNQNAQIPYHNQQMYGQNNLQFQPVVYPNQPIQQTNPIQMNYLYYPPQQQFFMAPQQQQNQQIPGIYEAQLGNYDMQPKPQMGVPLVKNPLNDGQTNYL
ncbi:transmembrane protein, putative (macronuclear) [Tetrahymena thermophila SB210]|uniref:Transmembrane protein, putative n=1 Tax=Tetrahymena thermophila (strain SB210) TaxID=312017 RepID=Q236C4_TETTS|nr:transmembrane protein, putative [Tetrahymena thermophila SB210]EAR92576.1 transmembrane protein, putative [Tetrahymena thermophila SB210]|eukprot:XP_001012821.1 transmembrane protein, putative [Tetrahymena thermophila SB210]